MYSRLPTATTDEVTVRVVWVDALRAKIPNPKIIRAFLIIIAKHNVINYAAFRAEEFWCKTRSEERLSVDRSLGEGGRIGRRDQGSEMKIILSGKSGISGDFE